MSHYLRREIEKLKKRILAEAGCVEQSVLQAVRSLQDRDPNLARQVIENDHKIDQMEVDIEEECLKILALYQPVAIDLRFIIAILKINNDLERTADLAVNIAERTIVLCSEGPIEIPEALPEMAVKSSEMLKNSLDSLVNTDAKLAREVSASDDEVDELIRKVFAEVERRIHQTPEETERLINLLSVGRHLERIADLATNIAEDVIYMVDGAIVRHHRPQIAQDDRTST